MGTDEFQHFYLFYLIFLISFCKVQFISDEIHFFVVEYINEILFILPSSRVRSRKILLKNVDFYLLLIYIPSNIKHDIALIDHNNDKTLINKTIKSIHIICSALKTFHMLFKVKVIILVK